MDIRICNCVDQNQICIGTVSNFQFRFCEVFLHQVDIITSLSVGHHHNRAFNSQSHVYPMRIGNYVNLDNRF